MKQKQMAQIKHSTLQSIAKRLSWEAGFEQNYRASLKHELNAFWKASDKSDPATGPAFDQLNVIKDAIRQSKIDEARTNEMIRFIRSIS